MTIDELTIKKEHLGNDLLCQNKTCGKPINLSYNRICPTSVYVDTSKGKKKVRAEVCFDCYENHLEDPKYIKVDLNSININ